MLVYSLLTLIFALMNFWDVNDLQVVSIQVDSLVTDNQLLELLLFVSHDANVTIINFQLVFNSENELPFVQIIFIEANNEETQLILIVIEKQIEDSFFRVVLKFFDCLCIEVRI